MLYQAIIIQLLLSLIANPDAGVPAPASLELHARIVEERVVERLPLVITLRLTNTGQSAVPVYYSAGNVDLMERWAMLVATDDEGNVFRLTYVGGPQVQSRLPAPTPLAGGERLNQECIRSLVFRTHPPARWAGKPRDLLEFLPPGSYKAYVELAHLNGAKMVSNQFNFTVAGSEGVDSLARDRISLRHVDFLEGRDAPSSETHYHTGRTSQGMDVSYFKELQDVLVDYPESTYAEWIRFWKLYHHGPVEESLQYARGHRDFPLSDNLMLHVAERMFNSKDYARAREVTAELARDFPNGDCQARAVDLQSKLSRKP